MEKLVVEKMDDYVRMFSDCKCPRCQADIKALSLTHLRPKYIVVDKSAASPLINFYSRKLSGDVVVQLTKACLQVNSEPHH